MKRRRRLTSFLALWLSGAIGLPPAPAWALRVINAGTEESQPHQELRERFNIPSTAAGMEEYKKEDRVVFRGRSGKVNAFDGTMITIAFDDRADMAEPEESYLWKEVQREVRPASGAPLPVIPLDLPTDPSDFLKQINAQLRRGKAVDWNRVEALWEGLMRHYRSFLTLEELRAQRPGFQKAIGLMVRIALEAPSDSSLEGDAGPLLPRVVAELNELFKSILVEHRDRYLDENDPAIVSLRADVGRWVEKAVQNKEGRLGRQSLEDRLRAGQGAIELPFAAVWAIERLQKEFPNQEITAVVFRGDRLVISVDGYDRAYPRLEDFGRNVLHTHKFSVKLKASSQDTDGARALAKKGIGDFVMSFDPATNDSFLLEYDPQKDSLDADPADVDPWTLYADYFQIQGILQKAGFVALNAGMEEWGEQTWNRLYELGSLLSEMGVEDRADSVFKAYERVRDRERIRARWRSLRKTVPDASPRLRSVLEEFARRKILPIQLPSDMALVYDKIRSEAVLIVGDVRRYQLLAALLRSPDRWELMSQGGALNAFVSDGRLIAGQYPLMANVEDLFFADPPGESTGNNGIRFFPVKRFVPIWRVVWLQTINRPASADLTVEGYLAKHNYKYPELQRSLEEALKSVEQIYLPVPTAGRVDRYEREVVPQLAKRLPGEGFQRAKEEFDRFISSPDVLSAIPLLSDRRDVSLHLTDFFQPLRGTLQALGFQGEAWVIDTTLFPDLPEARLKNAQKIHVVPGNETEGLRERLKPYQADFNFELVDDQNAAAIVIGILGTPFNRLKQVLIEVNSTSSARHVTPQLFHYLEKHGLLEPGFLLRLLYKGELGEDVLLFA